jgi:hypothetical protein
MRPFVETILMVTTRMNKQWMLAGALFLLSASTAYTQEKIKDAPKVKIKEETDNQPKARFLLRSGYTRPGLPADKIGKNGEIIQAALEPNHICARA